jgi:2-aminoadipate transaminase
VEAIKEACDKVLSSAGAAALQYNITEGYAPLREYIAARYYPQSDITADNIIITNGSQQGIDMLGRLFVNPGDGLLFERPGYLGAIQAFHMAQPQYNLLPMTTAGVDYELAADFQSKGESKLFYGVPNFQNPTGCSYSVEVREGVAKALEGSDTVYIEDNPYGEIRFAGEQAPPMRDYLGEKCVTLGSFSKVLAPALRIGWLCASKEIIKGIVGIKGATDMHTNFLSQRILHQYLLDNDFDAHIAKTIDTYRAKSELMISEIQKQVPEGVSYTIPEGGMFTWMTLPEDASSMELLSIVRERGMYFIPGIPFYVGEADKNTLRLNYSNSSDENIVKGIEILGQALKEYLA